MSQKKTEMFLFHQYQFSQTLCVCAYPCTCQRKKKHKYTISLLFYVLQHKNSVKILIFLHDISKECNILLSKCKPQPRDSYQDKTKNFMIHGKIRKKKKTQQIFHKSQFHFILNGLSSISYRMMEQGRKVEQPARV